MHYDSLSRGVCGMEMLHTVNIPAPRGKNKLFNLAGETYSKVSGLLEAVNTRLAWPALHFAHHTHTHTLA